MIVANLLRNVELSRRAVRLVLAQLPAQRDCGCGESLRNAIITPLGQVPAQAIERLEPIIGKYLPDRQVGVPEKVAGG